MRVQLWLTPILGLLLATCCRQELRAQYPPLPPGAGAYNGVSAPVRQADGKKKPLPAERGTLLTAFKKQEPPVGIQPGNVFGPDPFAVGMQPYPQISPFDNRFQQTTNDDGLWSVFTSNQNRKYFTTFEFLEAKTRHAKGLIGHPLALRYKDIYLPELAAVDTESAMLADAFQGDVRFIDGPGVFPARGLAGFNLFNRRFADYAAHVENDGFRLVTGYNDADGSGIVADFWFNGENSSNFDAARALTFRGNVGNPDSAGIAGRGVNEIGLVNEFLNSDLGFLVDLDQADTLQILRRNLLNLSSIPVDDGTLQSLPGGGFPVSTIGGTSIPYDLRFRLRNTTESLGTSFDFISTRSMRKKYFQAHLLMGGRYAFIKEAFEFEGRDSGLAYDNLDTDDLVFSRAKLHSLPTFGDDDGNFIVDDAIFVEDQFGGGGGGGNQMMGRALRLDLIADLAGTYHPGDYEAFVDAKMTTHLVGPEAGFNFSLGGDNFRINGHTKAGLMVNFEKVELRGDNIADVNNIGDAIDLDLLADPLTAPLAGVVDSPLLEPTTGNLTPNAFAQQRQTTHLSPLLEQKFTAEFPIFRYIPMLKRRDVMQDATITGGWSIIWVGEVARPTQSIIWTANPRQGLFPHLRVERSDWWTSNWSFGINIPF